MHHLECSQLTNTGAPAGDLTPWDEVYFPFAASLHEAGHLPTAPITPLTQEAPWIEERYTCDAHGIITVEMQNQTCPYTRRFHLRGTGPRAPLKVGVTRPTAAGHERSAVRQPVIQDLAAACTARSYL